MSSGQAAALAAHRGVGRSVPFPPERHERGRLPRVGANKGNRFTPGSARAGNRDPWDPLHRPPEGVRSDGLDAAATNRGASKASRRPGTTSRGTVGTDRPARAALT